MSKEDSNDIPLSPAPVQIHIKEELDVLEKKLNEKIDDKIDDKIGNVEIALRASVGDFKHHVDTEREKTSDSHQQELDRLEKKFDDKIDKVESNLKDSISNLGDRIDTSVEAVNNTLDEIDTAFRGNSRIGVFEQLRTQRRSMKIIWFLIALLFGLKIFATSIDDWINSLKKEYFPNWQKISKVEKIDKIDSNPEFSLSDSQK